MDKYIATEIAYKNGFNDGLDALVENIVTENIENISPEDLKMLTDKLKKR